MSPGCVTGLFLVVSTFSARGIYDRKADLLAYIHRRYQALLLFRLQGKTRFPSKPNIKLSHACLSRCFELILAALSM